MLPSVLLPLLPRIPPVDPRAQLHRARLTRYLTGPLRAMQTLLGEPCELTVDPPGRLPTVAAWWCTESGARIGLTAASLDGLYLFANLPNLPSGPDDLFARLAVDRPMAFSRARPVSAPAETHPVTLSGWLLLPGAHFQWVYQPAVEPELPEYPVRTPALDFSFACSLSVGFLPVRDVAGARRKEVIFPGWPAKDSAFLGRHDTWIPVRCDSGRWVSCGGWFMKPSPIDHFPLEISVEVGRIRLRGSALAALTLGAVLPLGSPVGSQVLLVYDNRLIARAELVVAGGELAVRLLDDIPALGEPETVAHDAQQGENP
ncbi:MAG: hypothetical protein CVU65_04000 [Deltaproteobacteria bacterium HGW-Deltaproteobacteria-22]|jgi:flagellar motor switch protein FliN/FliY|nr:MAG: hypothetical protein CVU65_04000 [Deltaproteobacteria bacterium HGW-Deltaproteobacteria-22]